MILAERSPRRAQRGVAARHDPRARENLLEVILAHAKEEHTRAAGVGSEDGADEGAGGSGRGGPPPRDQFIYPLATALAGLFRPRATDHHR